MRGLRAGEGRDGADALGEPHRERLGGAPRGAPRDAVERVGDEDAPRREERRAVVQKRVRGEVRGNRPGAVERVQKYRRRRRRRRRRRVASRAAATRANVRRAISRPAHVRRRVLDRDPNATRRRSVVVSFALGADDVQDVSQAERLARGGDDRGVDLARVDPRARELLREKRRRRAGSQPDEHDASSRSTFASLGVVVARSGDRIVSAAAAETVAGRRSRRGLEAGEVHPGDLAAVRGGGGGHHAQVLVPEHVRVGDGVVRGGASVRRRRPGSTRGSPLRRPRRFAPPTRPRGRSPRGGVPRRAQHEGVVEGVVGPVRVGGGGDAAGEAGSDEGEALFDLVESERAPRPVRDDADDAVARVAPAGPHHARLARVREVAHLAARLEAVARLEAGAQVPPRGRRRAGGGRGAVRRHRREARRPARRRAAASEATAESPSAGRRPGERDASRRRARRRASVRHPRYDRGAEAPERRWKLPPADPPCAE